MTSEPTGKVESTGCGSPPPADDAHPLRRHHSDPQLYALALKTSPFVCGVQGPQHQTLQQSQGDDGPREQPSVKKPKIAISRIKRMFKAKRKSGRIRKIVPELVSKALVLFIISLCKKAGEQARRTQSGRVSASHLKEAVMQGDPPGFGILRGIVAKVPDLAAL